MDYPITIYVTGGRWDDPTSLFFNAPLPADDQGYVTVQPHQYAYVTGSYTIKNRPGYMGEATPPEWDSSQFPYYTNGFSVGAIAPISNRYVWGWQAGNILNNAVGYDYGNISGLHSSIISVGFPDQVPGIWGYLLDYEITMTPTELVTFMNGHPEIGLARNKINAITGGGQATWSLIQTIHYDGSVAWTTLNMTP